jgi:ABC-2 type transport system ATP-binding protein
MKVRHLIAYTAAFYPNWNADMAERLVQRWEIPLEEGVATLSVGQLHRLSIVLSLAYEPELLILDEPAASLDPVARREFLSEVLNIAGQPNRTVLFSTHIISDIERVADTVAILKDGQIVYHGELGELKDSVKRLHLSAAAPLPRNFGVPGALSTRIDGNQAMVAARDVTPEVISELCNLWKADVQIEDLSLEDIFLEMHQP